MTGLKSGSGDDLWGDDGDANETADGASDSDATASEADEAERASAAGAEADGRVEKPPAASEPSDPSATENDEEDAEPSDEDSADATETVAPTESTNAIERAAATLATETTEPSTDDSQPYIVRRAVQDKSVQFERDERLTFFVHDDVADGERDLLTDLQSTLGRDVPKFDVREAVYRAALENPNDVLEELLKMGYSLDEE